LKVKWKWWKWKWKRKIKREDLVWWKSQLQLQVWEGLEWLIVGWFVVSSH